MDEPKVDDVNQMFETIMTNANPDTLKKLADAFQAILSPADSAIDAQDTANLQGGRRSAKKRGTQRKQKRRQRRGSRRAY